MLNLKDCLDVYRKSELTFKLNKNTVDLGNYGSHSSFVESQTDYINQINLLYKKLFENVKFDPVAKL
jgi:hypothetical protein